VTDLHLGLDLLFLVPGESGGRETYARELLGALRELPGNLRVTTFVNGETAAAGPGWWTAGADRTVALRRVRARSPVAWALGETVAVAHAASHAGVDVLHAPANFAPWWGSFARVLTVHDVLFRARPDLVAPAMRLGTEALVPTAARRADVVITVSAASRGTIAAELGVTPERIHVVPNGVAPPDARGDAARGRALAATAGRPLVLTVATALAHKNLDGLLEGLARLDPSKRPVLAIAGHGTDGVALARSASTLGVESDVRRLGAVPAGTLEDLWAAADATITTTLYEGFGLPVLEAMSRGVPVACSDLPVLREVAGDAAVWLDPTDAASVASALRQVLAAGPERERRVAAGRELAAGYSWRAAAARTRELYELSLAG